MTGIFTAPTLEEAKKKASDAFGAPLDEIEFKILEEPKKSLLGGLFGKKEDYRIEAVYTPAALTEEISEDTEEPEAEIQAPAEISEETESESTEEAETETETAETEGETNVPQEIQLEKLAIGAAYLEQVLAQLAPEVKATGCLDNGIAFNLEGNGAGSLIGRRGDTLDALQYLTSMVANRGDKDYVRLTIDTCGYRQKRRKALQDLAERISKSVLRTGRAVALEPMNPYERRIIHSTVTAIEGVSSHSSGEEPNRRVIITNDASPDLREERPARFRSGGHNDRRDRNDRGHGKGGRNDRRDRRDRRDRKPSGEGPRKLDLSTSFEKDYKRPKPEDALNAGVYGKIDF